MDDVSRWLLAIFILCVFGSAYFSCTESALSTMNKMRIKAKADDGNKRAKRAMYLVNNFDRALTTLVIGNNIVNVAAASISTMLFMQIAEGLGWNLSTDSLAVWCTLITTAIVFLFGEMIPKSLANDRSETMSMLLSGFMVFLMKILYPIVAFFMLITSFFTKLFAKNEEPTITEDELYDIIDTIEEEGVMDEEQSDLFKSALDFAATTVGDVMTMKDDICAIDEKMPNKQIIEYISGVNHSRIPVYRGSVDNIVGVINIRDFIKAYRNNPEVDIKRVMTKPYYAEKQDKIDELLAQMSQQKIHIAVVRDDSKNKNTLGIATIEDFLEELVGDIWDEEDEVDNNFVKLGGNYFRVNASMRVGEAFAKMKYGCDDRITVLKQIQPFVLEQFGKMPEEEESFIYRNIEITVEKIVDNRITEVVFHILDDDELRERLSLLEGNSPAEEEDEE